MEKESTRKTWSEYIKNLNYENTNWEDIVNQARQDYEIHVNSSFNEDIFYDTAGIDIYIPFNLERKYFEYALYEKKDLELAEKIIQKMKKSYIEPDFQNFIEMYEYNLNSMKHTKNNMLQVLSDTKNEFNHHIIMLTGLIVGIITILGTANQVFKVDNFNQGIQTFFSISIAIIFLLVAAFIANSFFQRKK